LTGLDWVVGVFHLEPSSVAPKVQVVPAFLCVDCVRHALF
jgi:hypothetical protein